MSFLDILKTLGQVGLQGLNQGGQAVAQDLMQQGNPQAYAQMQENQRQQLQQMFAQQQQQRQFEQQRALQQMITPYQQGEIAFRNKQYDNQLQWHQQEVDRQRDEDNLRNQQWLAQGLGEGSIEKAQPGDPDGFQINGQTYRPVKRSTFKTPKELADLGFPSEIVMNKENNPAIEKALSLLQAQKKTTIPKSVYDSFDAQIDKLYPLQATSGGGMSIPEDTVGGRMNNPGALKYARQAGAVQGEPATDGGYFAKFNTPEDGYQALKDQIAMDMGRGLNLQQYITKYAPPGSNNTAQYLQEVMQSLGGQPTDTLDKFDPDKLAQLQAHKESGATFDGSSPQISATNKKFNDLYKTQIHNLLDAGDKTRADTLMNNLVDAERQVKQTSDKEDAKTRAEATAGMAAAKEQLPDDKMEYFWRQVRRGALSAQDVEKTLGISDKYGRRRWAQFLSTKGEDLPIPLDSGSRNQLSKMEPVLDSLNLLKSEMKPYANDNRIGRFIAPRLQYAFGFASPQADEWGHDNGKMISTGEMDRLRGVSQSLAGLRTALPIFEQGQIHTPNFWKDSGRLINDKLDSMISYLKNNIDKIYKYGAKSGVVIPDEVWNQDESKGGLFQKLLGGSSQQNNDLKSLSNDDLFKRLGGGK